MNHSGTILHNTVVLVLIVKITESEISPTSTPTVLFSLSQDRCFLEDLFLFEKLIISIYDFCSPSAYPVYCREATGKIREAQQTILESS